MSAPRGGTWSIDPDAFADALAARYPRAQITRNASAPMMVEAVLKTDQGDDNAVRIGLSRNGEALLIEGAQVAQYAQLALWVRDLLPRGAVLVIGDQESVAEVGPDATASGVAAEIASW